MGARSRSGRQFGDGWDGKMYHDVCSTAHDPKGPCPGPKAVEALTSNEKTPHPCEWLIRKRGYYYRTNRAGYTASPHDAGRYTEAEAKAEAAIEPWHMSAVHISQALPGYESQDETPSDPASIPCPYPGCKGRMWSRDHHHATGPSPEETSTGCQHLPGHAEWCPKCSPKASTDRAAIDASALADAHRMYEAEHGEPFTPNGKGDV